MFGTVRALSAASLILLTVTSSWGGSLSPSRYGGLHSTAPIADAPLSVMTYNIKDLPWPIAQKRDAALTRIADRLAMMREQGRQPHIVLLQEAFTGRAAAIAARAGYRYVATGPDATMRTAAAADDADRAHLRAGRWDRGEWRGKLLGSGLIILSDHPIVEIDRMAFPDFACAGFDCLANKGVLIAHLRVPGFARPVSIVNTHLNARKAAGVSIERSQRAYARQAGLMAEFVATHVPADHPAIIGGDMNIGDDPRRSGSFFSGFARAGLTFISPHLDGARAALTRRTCGGEQPCKDLEQARGKAKDWLFARDDGGRAMPVASAQVPFGTEAHGGPLSDHFGYAITYAPAPQRLAAAQPQGRW